MFRKYVVALTVLIVVGLSIGAWALLLTPSSSLPPSNEPAQHNNPNWAFPVDSAPTVGMPDFCPVVAEVMPSVVSVTTETVTSDFFGRRYTNYVSGSGIVIDDRGYIVTNNHVVENGESVYVELADGRTFPAAVVGTDSLSDLAVVKIEATDLSYAYWGDSSSLCVGEWVLAIGNALGEGITATHGIVSRLDVSVNVRGNVLYGLILTDAPINPGNSGGPLVNMSGEVVGITSVKIVASEVEGMGYAISSNEARPIIQDLIRYGRVRYPWLGVGAISVDRSIAATRSLPVEKGALIAELVAGSPAASAGLRVNDVIIRFGGQEITSVADLVRAIRSSEIGEEVEIVFVRGKDTMTAWAQLVERPSS
ncbi:MAG: S1C family serine protease [Dehalococcoidia bacterium]